MALPFDCPEVHSPADVHELATVDSITPVASLLDGDVRDVLGIQAVVSSHGATPDGVDYTTDIDEWQGPSAYLTFDEHWTMEGDGLGLSWTNADIRVGYSRDQSGVASPILDASWTGALDPGLPADEAIVAYVSSEWYDDDTWSFDDGTCSWSAVHDKWPDAYTITVGAHTVSIDVPGKLGTVDGVSCPIDVSTWACDVDEDGVGSDTDCDDADPSRYPGAAEACDGVDNDCDGIVDEVYADVDGDGYGAAASTCGSADAVVGLGGDCDEADAGVHPGAVEVCNGVDDDCNGTLDDGWYFDADGDGFGGRPADCATDPLDQITSKHADCDDTDPHSYPYADEACDGVDNNCDGVVDEGWYADLDGDGFGAGAPDCASGAVVRYFGGYYYEGYSYIGDCDDADPTVHPGADEVCDGIDENCNGQLDDGWYADLDGDGWGGRAADCSTDDPATTVVDGTDCNDGDAAVHPQQPELCDGTDQDCDGTVDEGVKWFVDADGDGYGTPVYAPCGEGVATASDCDDSDPAVHPNAVEACDQGVDSHCDGTYCYVRSTGCATAAGASGPWWLLAVGFGFGGRRRRAA